MSGHGWVKPRPDGAKARCGGPAICPDCQREAAQLEAVKVVQNSEVVEEFQGPAINVSISVQHSGYVAHHSCMFNLREKFISDEVVSDAAKSLAELATQLNKQNAVMR